MSQHASTHAPNFRPSPAPPPAPRLKVVPHTGRPAHWVDQPTLFDVEPYSTDEYQAGLVRDGYLTAYRGHTLASYASDLRLWWRWCQHRQIPLLEAQRVHIETFDREMDQAGLKPSTRQRRLIAVCGFYRYAEEEGVLAQSPARYVRRPRVPNVSTSEHLERYEIGPFLSAAMALGPYHSALCHLLVYNGLRVAEVCGTSIEDLTFAGGHRTVRITRKGGAEAEVPLAPPTFRAVLLAMGERTSGPIILDALGERMTRHSAARAVQRAAREAGLTKRVGPHALRHTYISLALDAGVPLRDIQRDAGHADPSTTIRYDRRSANLDRHSTYVVAAYVGAG